MQQTRSPYQIAMLQMDCDLFHVSNNLDKAEKQIREAAAHGAKLIYAEPSHPGSSPS